MDSGKVIAEKILTQVNYPKNKAEKITHYVSIHDNWVYGEVNIYLKKLTKKCLNT